MNFFKEDIKNIGIIFTLFTAGLFGTAWVYETALLEEFHVNSYEFLPDTSELITYGFTVLFFKFFDHWLILAITGMILGPGILGGKELFKKYPKWKEHLHIKGATITLVGFIPLILGAWFSVVLSLSKEEAKDIKETKSEDIQRLLVRQQEYEIKGRVIRYRNGKVAFLSIPSGEVSIIPERNILHIKSNTILKNIIPCSHAQCENATL